MKLISKALFAMAMVLLVSTANAQTSFGVKAGLNASTITGVDDAKYKPGFHVGLATQTSLTDNFGLESGLYYSTLGFQTKEVEGAKFSANPSYLQLPLSLFFKLDLSSGLYLYPAVGVYAGYGIGGEYKIEGEGASVNLDYFKKSDLFENNKFDFGFNVGASLRIDQLSIGLGYDLGLTKINKKSSDENDDLKNGNIRVSVGYFFN